MTRIIPPLRWLLLAVELAGISGLAVPDPSAASSKFERFRVVCPADVSSIAQFDNGSVNLPANINGKDSSLWAAVYRSNSNNQPSVIAADGDAAFQSPITLNVIRATVEASIKGGVSNNLIETPMAKQKPVAIACLRPSEHFEDCWILDTMRCVLKKETMDKFCDGGSEHTEAVSAAIDSLLLEYLKTSSSSKKGGPRFESAIRTKGTLVTGVLLEARGFLPVESMQKDMATHVSSLDGCLIKYAERSLQTKSGARERALSIVAHLGLVDREADMEAAKSIGRLGDDDEEEYNPWANVNIF